MCLLQLCLYSRRTIVSSLFYKTMRMISQQTLSIIHSLSMKTHNLLLLIIKFTFLTTHPVRNRPTTDYCSDRSHRAPRTPCAVRPFDRPAASRRTPKTPTDSCASVRRRRSENGEHRAPAGCETVCPASAATRQCGRISMCSDRWASALVRALCRHRPQRPPDRLRPGSLDSPVSELHFVCWVCRVRLWARRPMAWTLHPNPKCGTLIHNVDVGRCKYYHSGRFSKGARSDLIPYFGSLYVFTGICHLSDGVLIIFVHTHSHDRTHTTSTHAQRTTGENERLIRLPRTDLGEPTQRTQAKLYDNHHHRRRSLCNHERICQDLH